MNVVEGGIRMTITSYFGLKPCCDCVHNYSDDEEEEK